MVMIEVELRELILSEPETLLEDRDVMNALVAANERALGTNIVDLRGIAMLRLETRLDRLEDTHRSVIAAAYENLAGTNQIHRAVLQLLDPIDFTEFLKALAGPVAQTLRSDSLRLIFESHHAEGDAATQRLGDVLLLREPGFVTSYSALPPMMAPRPVVLRQIDQASPEIYGPRASYIHSEALLRLDFGPGRLPGMLLLASEDPHHFRPAQGTDLLAFFAGTFERIMRRWLA